MNRLFNAWVFSSPMLIIGIYIVVFHLDAAKRMADMTGYSRKEKVVAVSASMSPHLFSLLTIFIPLSPNIGTLVTGALLYAVGLTGFAMAVVNYIKTPTEMPVAHGLYKISRNPMYVAAFMAYAGITVMTLNGLLAVLLIIMILLHHNMIKAEERACTKRFGKQYKQYIENTPRYMLI